MGTRNHQVRRLNIQTMDPLSPFEPPHMDTVTGVTSVRNHLISGSKDKNLRLWSLESSINNVESTVHAFNDYVTTLSSIHFSIINSRRLQPSYFLCRRKRRSDQNRSSPQKENPTNRRHHFTLSVCKRHLSYRVRAIVHHRHRLWRQDD